MGENKSVYLCAPRRTAIGSFQGELASLSASALGAHVVKAVLENARVEPGLIDEVILGCVLTAGVGQAPARQASLGAGLLEGAQAMTINKVCSSGLKAVMLAVQSVQLGNAEAVIAGGMESMSQAPYLLPKLRTGARLGHAEAQDSIITDGLWDVYNKYHMGSAAELCARECKISRAEQDEFAAESYRRANEAIEKGYFKAEIEQVTVAVGKDSVVVSEDEEPKRGKPEKFPQLKPAFEKDGTVTAANASSINDGAAAMLVCSEAFVKRTKVTPVARVVASTSYGQRPEWFTTAPVGAVEKLLQQTGVAAKSIDLFEINEAFAVVALACRNKLHIDSGKLNIHGGAVALGHPIGASGARILVTLLHALGRTGGKTGVAAICNGGGEATAMMVERV